MPRDYGTFKKRNRAGEQQNYIPSGNGDASGEYADDSGYNMHIQPKEDKPKVEPNKSQNENIVIDTKTNSNYDGFKDALSKGKMNEELRKQIEKHYNKGNEESKSLLEQTIKNGNYNINETKQNSYCMFSNGMVYLSKTNLNEAFRNEGETFWHETYHAIDGNYTIKENSYGWSASEIFVCSNGKTLCNTLKGRLNAKSKLEECKKDYEEFKKNKLNELHPEQKELEAKREQIENEIENSQEYLDLKIKVEEAKATLEKIRDDYFENKATYNELVEARNNKNSLYSKMQDIIHSNPKFNEITNKINSNKYDIENYALKTFGNISDVFAGQGYGYVFGMGHSSSYFKKDLDSRGHEFFAEYCSDKAINNQDSLNLLKKYFPEACQCCEDILNGIKNGTLITKKQKREMRG